jgi:hypothetical protein
MDETLHLLMPYFRTKIFATVSVVFTSVLLPGAYFLDFYTVLGLNGVWWSITGSSRLLKFDEKSKKISHNELHIIFS